MLLKALKPLAELRMSGKVQTLPAWIFVGDYAQPEWWKTGGGVEVVIDEKSPMARLDLRPLVGLAVCVQADRYSDPLMALCGRLKEYAQRLDVFVLAWIPDGLGMRWDRGQPDDWIPFGGIDKEAA